MYEFSVEQAANKIHDHRSREYFGEVLNNYFNGNYRSSVVMLWTVVICDLVYKLQYLREIHNDQKAIAILDEKIDFQKANPANPSWEGNLLKEVFERTNLLEAHEYDSLQGVQKHRHLSAHPVINKTDILFKPHREMVLSDIRIALDAVLTKPPILTKEVFSELVEDLEKIKDLFAERDQLKRYLVSKYFSNLNNEVSVQVFKSLWRITFRTEDEKCNNNREINSSALRILYEMNRELFSEFVKHNSSYFSEISGEDQIRYAIYFLGDYPILFELLSDAIRVVIRVKAETDIDLLTVSYFLSNNIAEHIEMLVHYISEKHTNKFGGAHKIHRNHINDLRTHASSAGIQRKVNILLITMYINSVDFDAGDSLFACFIKPYMSDFSANELQALIKGIGDNNQTYGRSRGVGDHRLIVDQAKKMISGFNVSAYPFLPQD